MTFRNTLFAAAAVFTVAGGQAFAQEATPAAAGAATAASASTAVAAGAVVKDTTGAEVGRIVSIEGENAVLDTGTNKVTIPVTSFATGPSGPIMSMTKAQVDQAASSAQQQHQANSAQQAAQAVTQGATVRDATGAEVGTIKSVDAQFALVDTSKNEVRLPLSAFAAGPNGPVIGMSKAELDAAAEAAAPASGGR